MLHQLLVNESRKSENLSFREIENTIRHWSNVIQILDDFNIPIVHVDALITEIIRLCADYFWVLYAHFGICFFFNIVMSLFKYLDDSKYIEMLLCFLNEQRNRTNSPNLVIRLLLLTCYLKLGHGQPAVNSYEEMDVRSIQVQSMGYICDYILESVGRMDEILKFYASIANEYRIYSMETDEVLVFSYREGRTRQALEVTTNILERSASIQRILHFCRRRILSLITTDDISELQYAIMTSFCKGSSIIPEMRKHFLAAIHPYDQRDFQLFLQNLPVHYPSYTAFHQARSYCLAVAEIFTLRTFTQILSGFANWGACSAKDFKCMQSSIERNILFILSMTSELKDKEV